MHELEKSLNFSRLPVHYVSPGNEASTSTGSQGNTRSYQESTSAQTSHTSSLNPAEFQQDQQRGSARRRRKEIPVLKAPNEEGHGKWILPVFQEKRYGAKAVHLPVEDIDSDEKFFIAMKERYYASTTIIYRWFSMRSVRKIHHVKVSSTRDQGDILSRLKIISVHSHLPGSRCSQTQRLASSTILSTQGTVDLRRL